MVTIDCIRNMCLEKVICKSISMSDHITLFVYYVCHSVVLAVFLLVDARRIATLMGKS